MMLSQARDIAFVPVCGVVCSGVLTDNDYNNDDDAFDFHPIVPIIAKR